MRTPASRPESIARDLLRIGAVSLRPDEPFTWASGRRSPVYTDNRLTLSHPDVRDRIARGFVDVARGLGPVEGVSGTATAGIAHGALLADRLRAPFTYVRSSVKGHGKENRIEGRVGAGQRVVVVEDLVSTGGSVLSAARALRDAGAEPVAALAVFTYGFPEAAAAFEAAGLPLHTLTDFDTLARAAQEAGALGEEGWAVLQAWREDPAAWSRAHGGAG